MGSMQKVMQKLRAKPKEEARGPAPPPEAPPTSIATVDPVNAPPPQSQSLPDNRTTAC